MTNFALTSSSELNLEAFVIHSERNIEDFH